MTDNLLGRVQILLEANTAKLETGMVKAEKAVDQSARKMTTGFQGVTTEVKKTQGQVDSFSNTISKHEAEVRNVAKSYDIASFAVKGLSAIAAGVSISSLATYANNYIEKATEIQRFADLVGSSTQEFQFYAAGANVAGISLEKFADINKDALDKLGDALAGQGEMMDFFDQIAPKIGVTIDQFKELSGPEVIQKYFDGLRQANVSHAETIKFMEQIANDGSLLIPMLEDGGKGFVEWGNAAQNAGSILSDTLIKDLKETKKNIALLNLEWQGFQANIVNNVVPVLTVLKDNSDIVKASATALGAYVGTQLVLSLSRATIAGYAKSKQLVEQTVVQYAAIQAEKAASAQELISAQAQVSNTQATLAALAAERALEIQRLKSQISAQGLAASQTRLAQVSVIEAQVKAELIVANNALAASQARVNAASNDGVGVGRGLLGALGGPVGLGLTVATVAASYLLLKDNTEDSTKSLRDNNLVVADAVKQYQELDQIQRGRQLVVEREELQQLNEEYDKASAKLSAYATRMGSTNEFVTESQIVLEKLFAEYQKTGNLEAFNNAVQGSAKISQTAKDQVAKLAASVNDAGKAASSQKEMITQLGNVTASTGKKADVTTQSYIKMKQVMDSYKESLVDRDFNARLTSGLLAKGYDEKQVATMVETANYARKQGVAVTNEMYKASLSVLSIEEKNQQIIANRNKEQQASTKELEKQQKLLTINAKVQSLSSKYNISSRAAAAGIPQGLIEGMIMQESRGDTYRNGKLLTSPVGAQGVGQFMPGTAKQYGVDVRNEESGINGMIKYMSALIKQFGGDVDKAIMAYNAGPGNVRTGRAYGFKETKDYLSNVKSYAAGANGFAGTPKDFDKNLQDQTKSVAEALKEQDRIREQYFSKWEQVEHTHNQNVEDIRNAYAHDTSTRDMLLQRENDRNAKAIEEWIQYEDQRVKEEIEANQDIILARQEAFQSMNSPIGQITEIGIQATAQASFSSAQMNSWNINNQQQEGYSQLGNYLGQANEAIRNNELLTEQERYAELEQVYQQYLVSKKALGEQYAIEEKELAKSQHQEQLNLWGSLVSQAQNTWGMITQSIKDSAGEQSAAYKVAFIAQQSFAFASAIISAQLASAQVAADASITFFGAKIAASKAMLAMGYASAGMIAAQTVAGIAHGGLENVPAEATYLLDKDERVLSPRQNKDLTNYLETQKTGSSGGGDVYFTQHIEIASDGSAISQSDAKELGRIIENGTLATIRKELRQGGMLNK